MPKEKENGAAKKDKTPQADIVSLLDEAIALVPGTDVEIAVLERYGSDKWKERMLAVREKLTQVRERAAQVVTS